MSDTRMDNFSALYEVTQTIGSILEPKRLLEQVLEIAMKRLDAERGFLLLTDQNKEAGFTVAASRNFAGADQSSALAASSSVVKKVLSSGESVLAVDAGYQVDRLGVLIDLGLAVEFRWQGQPARSVIHYG